MGQAFELILVLAGLLAVVVGAGGKEGKLGSWLFPAPLTSARQRIVIAVGIVAVLLGTVSFVYRISPSSEAAGADGSPQNGQQPPDPPPDDILREGDAPLKPGDSLNMETGQFGQGVDQPDISLAAESDLLRRMLPAHGAIADIYTDASPSTCAEELKDASSGTYVHGGNVYCLRTSGQHFAAVQIRVEGTNSAADEPTQVHYIVWKG